MKYIGGNSLFTHNIDRKESYPCLNKNIDCDVAIIGGGVTGALCSYFFNEKNASCVVIEQDLIGRLSTSICTSILEYEIDVDLNVLEKFIGKCEAETCFNLGKEAVSLLDDIINKHNIDCDFRKTPCFYYSNEPDDIPIFKKEFQARKNLNDIEIEYFSKEDCFDKFPFPVQCGLYTKNAASTFNPYKFTTNLFNNLNKLGVKIFENTKLINTSYCNDEVILTTSTGNTIKAKKVVICTGYAAAKLINNNIASFTRTFNIVTEPIKSTADLWFNNCTIIDNSTPYYYCRTTPDNRIILGGEDITDLGYDENKINSSYNKLKNKLKLMFPNLDTYNIDFKYNGLFADSKCSIPYIGEHSDFPNHYFCLGYGSNGVLYSTFGAKLLANHYVGLPAKELNIFSISR